MRKNSLTSLLFIVFVPFLLVFFWRNAIFWFDMRVNQLESSGDLLFAVSLVLVELIASFLVLYKRKLINLSGVHLICISWEIIMMAVLMFNGAVAGFYTRCLLWPLLFEATFLFVKDNGQRVDSIRKQFYWVLLLGLYVFFAAMGMKDYETQSNMIYFLVLPIPILLLTPNEKSRNIILILITFFCLLSMKRSMILAIGLFWAIICIKQMSIKKKNIYILLIPILMLVGGYAVYSTVEDITKGALSSRLDTDQEDVTNGREAIYLVTIDMIAKSTPIEFILGHGHNAVKRDSVLDISAHNEWLEIIYDYGLIALFLYFLLWVHLIKRGIFHYKCDTKYFIPFTLSLCFFAVMSMVSQLIVYVSYFLYLVMFWAIVEALSESEYMDYRLFKRKHLINKLK